MSLVVYTKSVVKIGFSERIHHQGIFCICFLLPAALSPDCNHGWADRHRVGGQAYNVSPAIIPLQAATILTEGAVYENVLLKEAVE